ncbi:MAG: OmpA family protein [Polyangiaceae bacterium]|nr:OmpA family protein [Polyangiaceae bacterium]
MARSTTVVLAAFTVGVFSIGCGSDPSPPPASASSAQTGPATTSMTAAAPRNDDTATPTSGSVHIDDKIVKACGNLPTPHFAFDSANIQQPARDTLNALAECFSKGALKGKEVKLVGHADPRGDIDYNLGLGHRRAGSVAEYLAKQGVEKDRLDTTSKGEFEASGSDEDGWAKDRKVEILLGE